MLPRRVPDEPLERIRDRVERAKADLVEAVPSPRGLPGRALADALASFEEGLWEAAASLDPATRPEWRAAVEESLRRAERLRLDAPALDYEGLVTVLADLLAPLDAFA